METLTKVKRDGDGMEGVSYDLRGILPSKSPGVVGKWYGSPREVGSRYQTTTIRRKSIFTRIQCRAQGVSVLNSCKQNPVSETNSSGKMNVS